MALPSSPKEGPLQVEMLKHLELTSTHFSNKLFNHLRGGASFALTLLVGDVKITGIASKQTHPHRRSLSQIDSIMRRPVWNAG